MFISHYEKGNIFNHDETRTRKLLMHKDEIKKLFQEREILNKKYNEDENGENLSANFEKPSRSINRGFTENLTGLNAKKNLR